jgi:glycosyltransferase involved in cell wall biosynthesis
MKVLHVISSGERRGAEVFASDLVSALDPRGLLQHVAILHGSGPLAAEMTVPVSLLRADGRPLPGLRIHPAALRSLRALVTRWGPDVIQAHGGEPLKYCVGARPPRSTRLVYRRIGSVHPWLSRGPKRALYAGLIRRADAVVAVADMVRQETIIDLRTGPEKVVTIPNGVDPIRIRPVRSRDETRASLGISSEATLILSVGALSAEKNPLGTLDVAAEVMERVPLAAFVAVGEGPLRGELERRVDRLQLAERARILGRRSDVGDLLHASDVLLLASHTEGMPACLIEAGMARLPVAAYAVGGIPEVVEHGRTGLLVAPGHAHDLASALERLVGDATVRSQMGEAAFIRCRGRFGIDVVADAYSRLYELLMAPRVNELAPS